MTVLICFGALYAGLHGLRLALAYRHLRKQSVASGAPGIAIIQPILSGDPALAATLEANLRAAPDAQFVWLIDDDDAEAHRAATTLAESRVQTLSLPPPCDGENPKLKKLIAGTPQPVEAIVVLDDDTTLRPGGAARLAATALAQNGLATAIPIWGRAPQNAPEALVAGFINGQGASTYFAMSALGRNRTINGMAYAVASVDLVALGGFAAAGHEVTDDWAVARLFRQGGRPLIQTTEPAEVAVSLNGAADALRLLRRWMQFAHRYMAANADAPLVALVVIPGLLPLWGLGLAAVLGLWPTILWLALLVARAALHARLVRHMAGGAVGGRWGFLAVVAAELLLPILSLSALWRPRRIRWRSRRMELDGETIRFR